MNRQHTWKPTTASETMKNMEKLFPLYRKLYFPRWKVMSSKPKSKK